MSWHDLTSSKQCNMHHLERSLGGTVREMLSPDLKHFRVDSKEGNYRIARFCLESLHKSAHESDSAHVIGSEWLLSMHEIAQN